MPVLNGHLELTCALDAAGRTHLSHQACSVPSHVGKPYWDGHALVVQVANPTAGIFAGDTMTSEVRVESGARVLLTTPSASRAHTMPQGHATSRQSLHAARDAWLEVMPELFIPQAGCRYTQSTTIQIEPGGQLFFVETLAPGRTARGECFAFTEVNWHTDITVGDQLIARERYRLRPDDLSLASWRQPFPSAYYASCYLVGSDPDVAALHDLNRDDVLLGVSHLAHTGWNIKILAADSPTLKETLVRIRQLMMPTCAALNANPRKL